jgi:hypothetical protein
VGSILIENHYIYPIDTHKFFLVFFTLISFIYVFIGSFVFLELVHTIFYFSVFHSYMGCINVYREGWAGKKQTYIYAEGRRNSG